MNNKNKMTIKIIIKQILKANLIKLKIRNMNVIFNNKNSKMKNKFIYNWKINNKYNRRKIQM